MQTERAIISIRMLLTKDSFDVGHDLEHHTAVVGNCLQIIKAEKLKLDLDPLLIAAWIHDYKRGDDDATADGLRKIMTGCGATDEEIAKVLDIMGSHTFGEMQESIEAKVLFDADKLEYVNPRRLNKVLAAVESSEMEERVARKYGEAFHDRIPVVFRQLHFGFTIKEFRARFKIMKDAFTGHPLWNDYIADLKLSD